jgi:hypothetical protein
MIHFTYPNPMNCKANHLCITGEYSAELKVILQISLPNSFFKLLIHRFTCLAVLLLFLISTVSAQRERDYAIHANIIYHFTKYIDWPENKKYGDFIIGIVGDSPLYDELKIHADRKKVGNQKIIIKRFSASSASFNCHILFVGEEESDDMKKIDAKTSNSAILLVSENDGLAKKGSCINFIVVNDRLKMEINKNNIEERGLNIASELLQLGKIIK